MFTGEYRHSVDEKGRIAVPSKFRSQLEGGAVVSRWIDGCLAIHTAAGWASLADKISALPVTDAPARLFGRSIFAGATEADLDKQGRILLPAYLREGIGLASEALVIGARDHADGRPGGLLPGHPGPGDLGQPHAQPGFARDPMPAGSRVMKDGSVGVHVPVLAEEVVTMLAPAPGSLQIDATVGGGGHTERILEATDPDGRLLGLDADGAAIARVRDRLAPRFGDRLRLRQANFRELADVAPDEGFAAVDGCFFDLGLSSFQLADADRGFGFRTGGPLDMRFDTSRGVPAAELLATLDAGELTALFRRYGEEPFAGRISRAIVEARRTAPVETAEDLAALVERVTPSRAPGRRRIHPATRVFQALRIAVNEELEALEEGLAAALDLLRPGGRLVVLSYHSLEDRIVKRFLQAERRGCVCPPELPICVCGRSPRVRLVTPKGLVPGDAEVAANPRARSARLRAAERLAA
jgi:16S rRNA (cytosine1402-N4)-methyltransferase